MESSRIRQAKQDLGIVNVKEKKDIDDSINKEIKRQKKKAEEKLRITQSQSYRYLKTIATVMDKYLLDPILGFIPGGDALASVISLPFIYVSLFKIKSIPLTLAVIYNIMKDVFLGMIPFFIGDIIDVFNRSYLQNLRLIVGFVEDDHEIIKEVNKKALRSFIGIVLMLVLIYFMIKLVASLVSWIVNLFN